jgi:signal transduction histidine kinase
MKLKTRFAIIIVGTFVVPVLVTSLVMFLFAPDFLSFKMATSEVGVFALSLKQAQKVEDVVAAAQGLPAQVSVLVFDEGDKFLFRRDAPGFGASTGDDFHQQSVFTREVVLPDGQLITVLVRSVAFPLYMPLAGLAAILSVLFFLIFLSSRTVRSIERSIHKLEESTRRIADGDMETPVVVDGDDTFVALAHSFDGMRMKVKAENDRRMRFFMGVSHDLKTPLASITGYSEALLDGLAEDASTRDRYLKIIHTKGKLLDRRIAQLIQYIKITDDSFHANLKRQPLAPFLETFLELQQEEASLLGGQLDGEIALPLSMEVSFNQDLLTRAMENLLQNCFRYGDTTKPVRMMASLANEGVHIAFINSYKAPIPPEVLEHVFEPFYRGDQSRKGEGFGLGLASVKSIMDIHGWRIEGRSNSSESTTVFQMVIPKS